MKNNAVQIALESSATELTLEERKAITERERLVTFQNRKIAIQPGFSYKQKFTAKPTPESATAIEQNIEQNSDATPFIPAPVPPHDSSIFMEPHFTDPNITQSQKAEIQRATICAATGTASEDYGRMILGQTVSGFFHGNQYDVTTITNATQEALLAMDPADVYEGMLCSHLLVLHDHCMRYMSICAIPGKTQQVIDMYTNMAMKLMRMYNETLDVLNRHRRKGEQKVTVQHVNVNNGGQAVVTGQLKT
jgi:hypothetical protein